VVNSTERRWERERRLNKAKYGQNMTNIELAGAAGYILGSESPDIIPPIWAMRWWKDQKVKQKRRAKAV